MEKIELLPFSHTSSQLTFVLLKLYFRRKWWLYLILFSALIFVLTVKSSYTSFDYFFFVFVPAYPILVILSYFIAMQSKKNLIHTREKKVVLENGIYNCTDSEGNQSKIKIKDVVSVVKMKNAFALYISANNVILLPYKAFLNETDKQRFMDLLFQRG